VSSSYSQILRSSAITGGAAGINMLIGMVSVKFGAVLLGPAAFGQLRVFQALIGFAGTLLSFGIQDSAIRRIARAGSTGELEDAASVAVAARRIGWILGLSGWILVAACAWPVSQLVFGSHDQAIPIVILSVTLLLSSVTGSRIAVFRGFRRIGDLARIGVWSAGASTVVSASLYAWLRDGGVVPAIICSAMIAFVVPCLYQHKLPQLPRVVQRASETARIGWSMAGLGAASLTAGIASAAVGIAIPAMVTRELGADAMGMYAAAWGLSGLFANFILNAMGADYYPRLSGAAHDSKLMARLVNEQTAVGVLLALPGLVTTVVVATLAIRVFYSAEFEPAAALLPWYALGIFGRVTSWPLGFVLLARHDAKTFIATEICFALLWVGLTQVGMVLSGLVGVAWSFCALYAIYNAGIMATVGARAGIRWDVATTRLVLLSLALFAAVAASQWLPNPWGWVVGGAGVFAAGIASLRGLAFRLGRDHRLVRRVSGLPVISRVLP
jgi:PST family polysaccharide transporter